MANACGRTRRSLRDPTPAKNVSWASAAALRRPRRVARQFGARRRIVIGGIHSRREMIKWNQKGRHDLRRVFLFGAGYGNRTRLLGLGSRCTTDVLILQIWIALRAMIREYSGGGAASVTLRILIWRGRQICVRCAPAALTRQKCLCSPPPPRMPKPMYYRCTNPAYARSGAGTCAVRLFYHPAARFATVLCRFAQISPAGAARRGAVCSVRERAVEECHDLRPRARERRAEQAIADAVRDFCCAGDGNGAAVHIDRAAVVCRSIRS